VFAGRHGDGYTFGTIGKGDFKCTEKYSYDGTIRGYKGAANYSGRDLVEEAKNLPAENQKEIKANIELIQNLQKEASSVSAENKAGILEGKLKVVADKANYYLKQYNEYAESSPMLAKTYLICALVLAKGVTGGVLGGISTGGVGIIPGFIAGVSKGAADEVKGIVVNYAIGDDIGEFINKGIQEYSPHLIKLDSKLSPQDAAMLATIVLATMLSSSEFISFAKSMKGVDFSSVRIVDGKVEGVLYLKKELPGFKSKMETGSLGKTTETTHASKIGSDAGSNNFFKANEYAKDTVNNLAHIEGGELAYLGELQKLSLGNALKSQAMEKGQLFAGTGHGTVFRDAYTYVNKYGGNASDYVKMTSKNVYRVTDTAKVQTHWVENIQTGQRYDVKMKVTNIKSGAE
jgi:hypothetical protein